jgi:succinate dehydrogenase / fumarate reductase, cytochrome b subunit
MIPLRQAISSSIGRKLITALTGIALVLYVVLHLLGNLTLYLPGGQTFNQYAAGIQAYGPLVKIAEVGLFAVILFHVVNGFMLKRTNSSARPTAYRRVKSKGGGRSNIASRNMALSGIILLAFIVVHVWQFRFGPGIEQGYVAQHAGQDIRDFYRLVVEIFKNPLNVGFYALSMLLLGLHLRHGVWSAFQSLGTMNNRVSGGVYCAAWLFALIFAAGFLFIPVYIYFAA